MVGPSRRFKLADTAQQIVGGFLLAGPFVVTEEVWTLAVHMSWWQTLFTVLLVFGIGYGTLYKAEDRDPDREVDVGGIPVRFVSLILVSYASVVLLAIAFDAPQTFVGGQAQNAVEMAGITLKAVSVGAVFSVIGAATADSLF